MDTLLEVTVVQDYEWRSTPATVLILSRELLFLLVYSFALFLASFLFSFGMGTVTK